MAEGTKARAFISTTTVKVDAKGRLSVPASLRTQLVAMGGEEELVAYPNFKLPCIECCHRDRLDQMCEATDELDVFSEQVDDIQGLIFGLSQALAWDTTGRITLPDLFIEHARIAGAAVITGMGRTFRIWNPEEYKADLAARMQRAKAEGLSLVLSRSGVGK